VIAFAQDKGDTCVQVLFIRGGRLIGREYFMLDGAEETASGEILSNFITQFYEGAAAIPERSCCQVKSKNRNCWNNGSNQTR